MYNIHPWMDESDGAGEVRGALLAALVEEEGQVDGDVELDAEDVGPDGGAEAHSGVEVGEPAQERATLLVRRHTDPELQQVQHVGAHAQLQRVDRAAAPASRWHDRRWADRRGRNDRRAVGPATLYGGEEDQVQGEEEGELRRRHCSYWSVGKLCRLC
uniref:Uncharacterized protein n=1 Tax=Triticum urartu TaxID=4572 RepID=A0A8R7VDW2_TRIUA